MPDSEDMSPRSGWLGRCFKVECSHGDARPSWFQYRRVIAETSQVAECVRIEARGDGSHVLYLADPISKVILSDHEEISPSEFHEAEIFFIKATTLIAAYD